MAKRFWTSRVNSTLPLLFSSIICQSETIWGLQNFNCFVNMTKERTDVCPLV